MGFLNFFRRKKRRSSSYKSAQQPDPNFLGDFLVFQLLGDKFNLKLEQLPDSLSTGLQDLVKLWALLYVAWLYRNYVATKYGQKFKDKMMLSVKSRLQKADKISNSSDNLLEASIEFWFDQLDSAATRSIGIKVNGVEVPFVVFAAMTFLVRDASSPYYKKAKIDNQIEFDVGEVLELAGNQVQSFIETAIEIGRPIGGLDVVDVWSDNPGCFERHLQRRYNNPLFPPHRRSITVDEVINARARDKAEVTALRKDIETLLLMVRDLPSYIRPDEVSNIRNHIDELIRKASYIVASTSDIISVLINIRKELMNTLEKAFEYDNKVLETLHKAEYYFYQNLWKNYNYFMSQLSRQDTPILPEDIVPALLGEELDTIQVFVEAIGDEQKVEQIRQAAVELVKIIREQGIMIPGIEDKLKALDIATQLPQESFISDTHSLRFELSTLVTMTPEDSQHRRFLACLDALEDALRTCIQTYLTGLEPFIRDIHALKQPRARQRLFWSLADFATYIVTCRVFAEFGDAIATASNFAYLYGRTIGIELSGREPQAPSQSIPAGQSWAYPGVEKYMNIAADRTETTQPEIHMAAHEMGDIIDGSNAHLTWVAYLQPVGLFRFDVDAIFDEIFYRKPYIRRHAQLSKPV